MEILRTFGHIENVNGRFSVCLVENMGDLWLATYDPIEDEVDTLSPVKDLDDALRKANDLFKTQPEYVVELNTSIKAARRSFTKYPKSYIKNATGGSVPRLKVGHWYKFNDRGEEHTGQYTGRDQGFECCVCDKGCRAYTFNLWHSDADWETWGYGPNHLPTIIEDLGDLGNDVIVDE